MKHTLRPLWTAVSTTLLSALAGCASGPLAPWTPLVDASKGLGHFDRVGTANWAFEGGLLVATQGGNTPAYLVTKDSYRDFEMRVEFWSSDDANSGIFFRCKSPQQIDDKTCYEANIFDQRPDPTYGTGAIVNIAKVVPMPKAGGKWNTYLITAKGDQLILELNGQKTVDVRDSQLKDGPIALQWGRGVVKFRKAEVRRL